MLARVTSPSPACPVCARAFEVEAPSPGVYFRGARITFCSVPCMLAFKREPERYAQARPAIVAPEPSARRSPFQVRHVVRR